MIWTTDRIAAAQATLHKWHGTPHCDRAAVEGSGIDCAMLVNEILIDAGIVPRVEFPAYSTVDGSHNQSARLAKAIESLLHVQQVSIDAPEFGDIAVCRTGKASAHVMFIAGDRIWHSLVNVGVTHGKYRVWKSHIAQLYRLTDFGFKSLEFL